MALSYIFWTPQAPENDNKQWTICMYINLECVSSLLRMLHVKMSGGQQEISCTESCESSAAAEFTNSYVSINL